ncbi:hypothetical protein GGI07_005240 [Coemansia sp. Benny D115]|nr:hypothetical protein GGI07_005240 [Coemansia sp. Benny D115]
MSKFDLPTLLKENSASDGIQMDEKPEPSVDAPRRDTQRYTMYKALHRRDPDEVWKGFTGILKRDEWWKVTEYDVARVMKTLNMQYGFDRNPVYLERVRFVHEICQKRGLRFCTVWPLNEVIRLHVAAGDMDKAFEVKDDIDNQIYGPDVSANVHTYAALLSNTNVATMDHLLRMTRLYDEMVRRGIEPNINIEKALFKVAKKTKETRLLQVLLNNTSSQNVKDNGDNAKARYIVTRAQAYISLYDLGSAIGELINLLSLRLPTDQRRIPSKLLNDTSTTNIRIPEKYAGTRDAYFVYLRSLYESIIRIYLIRNNIRKATQLLSDLRQNCYLAPTQRAYGWFVRYHAKRKNIGDLVSTQELMLLDDVSISEHLYTKFITACMFSPSPVLLERLVQKASRDEHNKNRQDADAMDSASTSSSIAGNSPSTRTRQGYADNGYDEGKKYGMANEDEKVSTPPGSGLPEISASDIMAEVAHRHVYYPEQCTVFFDNMLEDYGVDSNDITDTRYTPNVSITNAIMRAYLALGVPGLALREFNRYCYHQKRCYPSEITPDMQTHKRTVTMVFRMALDASSALRLNNEIRKIQAIMNEWGVEHVA